MQLSEEKNGTRKFRHTLFAAAVILALIGGAIGRGLDLAAQEKASTSVVSIDNFSFTPMELTISAGTSVIWINKDDVPHTVVSVDHKFKSQALDTDERFSFTFQQAGTYEYFCSVHPRMVGKILVK